jgi:hypothetical protein
MEARESFTALDISNMLIAYGFPVRHRAVAQRARAFYFSGAARHYDYRRQPIEALAGESGRTARTFLYHHAHADPQDYALRRQCARQPAIPPKRSQRDDRRRSRSHSADHCRTALIRRS